MNKIDFFNEVVKIHDEENHIYNERLVDMILSLNSKEFDIFYEIFEKINKEKDISLKPYKFVMVISEESGKSIAVDKFTFKVKNLNTIEELFKKLKKEYSNLDSEYCTGSCTLSKNSKKGIIFITFSNLKFKHDSFFKQNIKK